MAKPKTIYSKEHEKLTAWLVARRKLSGSTVRQLAEQLGWPAAVVGKIFTGDRRLDVVEYADLCAALGADACEGLEYLKK